MRKLHADIKVALKSLRANRTRTILTIIGVIIGVSAVTASLSLGEGLKANVGSQVSALGDDFVTIRSGDIKNNQRSVNSMLISLLGSSNITESDLSVVKNSKLVSSAAPLALATGIIKSGPLESSSSVIVGTNSELQKVIDANMRSGSFLDEATPSRGVVLGRDLAIELTGSDVSLGHIVQLRGQDFTVTGILEGYSRSSAVHPLISINNSAFINLSEAKILFNDALEISQINARLLGNPGESASKLSDAVLANHSGQKDFSVYRATDTVGFTNEMFSMVFLFISMVAAISILVGGVGIMNIMLVSVIERTREIGIRKAVGATNRHILTQFMIEGMIMSITGGILGLIFGFAIAFIIGTSLGVLPLITWWIVVAGIAISILTGLVFGAWPSIRAARKDPIEALRNG